MRLAALLTGLVLALSTALAGAHEVEYKVILDGASESPSNASPGSGTGLVTFDLDLVTMRVQASFVDLMGTTSASHIHCCTAVPGAGTAGVATVTPSFTGFPLGVTSGSYDHTFDLSMASSYNPAFITASGGTVSDALNALLFGAADGKAYLNIHTSMFPGGEIRGFLVPVPEPGTYLMLLAGLGLFGFVAARRARR